MLSIKRKNLKLVPRNEGKIKSYDSCLDLRAWNHDINNQDRYLRDWIKSDMPVYVIPISTVTNALRMMSWRRRGKVAQRCHPECKSKAVLDSIYKSCHAVKECFMENNDFTKYFEEEEFETAHWPCDRCLDALKSIKLFWKIILDKIFKVKFPSNDEVNTKCIQDIKSIASVWQKELIEQAIFVKNLTPFISDKPSSESSSSLIPEMTHKNSQTTSTKVNRKNISTNTDLIMYNTRVNRQRSGSLRRKLSRCTSIRLKTVDVACLTYSDTEKVDLYRNNLDNLQQQHNLQAEELRRLRNENMSLKLELRNLRNNAVPSYTPVILCESNCVTIPTPYESFDDEKHSDTITDIESEMVISLKNCKNKNFRHVSMLQVLHKSNSVANENFNSNQFKKSEDPIEVLTKVHNTFGAIVKRELTIANKKKVNLKNVKDKCRRNCSLKSSHSTISDSIFVSSTQV